MNPSRIDGKLYYFDKNGYRINDVTNIYKSGYTVEVDRINGVMTIYADANRTIPVKTIRVSVGNPGTDTPTGRYKLTRYSRWQGAYGTVLGTVWYSCRWCWSGRNFRPLYCMRLSKQL